MSKLQIALSGKAQVYCIHDREKRQIVNEAQVELLGFEVGIMYDRRFHKLHKCACCENLFVDPTDEPRYCTVCTGKPVHMQQAPLPPPIGVVQ